MRGRLTTRHIVAAGAALPVTSAILPHRGRQRRSPHRYAAQAGALAVSHNHELPRSGTHVVTLTQVFDAMGVHRGRLNRTAAADVPFTLRAVDAG